MRIVEIPRPGPPEVLRLREAPDPVPRNGELLVDVRAIGVNFADIMGRLGLYPDAPPFPYVPGYEVAGVAGGRRVIAATRFKGYSEKITVRPEDVVDLPEGLSFEAGAALPVTYLTAWVALIAMARLAQGDRVLIEHAAGGVGLAAIQIALHAGAEVYGVAGSAEKVERLRTLGVNAIPRGAAWPQRLDVILDPTGWKGIERSLQHLRPSGRLVLFGASELVTGLTTWRPAALLKVLRRPRLDPLKLMNQNHGVFGLNLLTYWGAEHPFCRMMEPILQGVRDGWVKPQVCQTFPLERAAEAHAFIQERKNFGKVILTVGTPPNNAAPPPAK